MQWIMGWAVRTLKKVTVLPALKKGLLSFAEALALPLMANQGLRFMEVSLGL